ncbi:MAG TPA: DNA helicase PcrA [Armatimonadota bacterium]|jgi:DNA helicase-2/ATP-dependent DNA helicase PcrA
MATILDNLNPAQRDAVLHGDGPLLIFAGAGSGKTRVLTHRIAHLISERNVTPWQILAVTFTNKAANEMKSRIEALVGGAVARDMWVGTFHAICARLLRYDGDKNGLDPRFTVYDDSDQIALVKECLKELDLADNKNIQPRAILSLISKAKEKLIPSEQYRRHFGGGHMEDIAGSVYRLYEERLSANNALDFDDLLMQAVLLLRARPEVLEKYAERFRYVLVDEYQDINTAQYHLVKLLASRHRNLCCVGDDDQSIYGWRGANVELILAFERDYPDARVVKLEQNYRSTGNILSAAHAVVSKNRTRKEKKLWTESEAGEKIQLFAAQSEREEAMWVGERIREYHAGTKRCWWKDFAILYRTNAMSRVFEDVFMAYKIPYRIVGGLRFYERKEVKDLVAYLRVVGNTSDSVSLRRVVNVPPRGIGATSFGRVEEFAARNGISLFDACARASEIDGVIPKTRAAITNFVSIIRTLQVDAETRTITELARKAMDDSGYLAHLKQDKSTEAQARVENLMELLTVTQEFESRGTDGSLSAFLESVSLMSDIDEAPENEDAVVLMTLHSAKGLEFPIVFLVGMEEGIFPHIRSLNDQNGLEEERRLAYVGITRARSELFMTYAFRRQVFGSSQANAVSRFVGDVPPELINDRRPGQSLAPPWRGEPRTGPSLWEQMQQRSVSGPPPAPSPRPTPATPFKPGRKVKHAKFGEGTVVDVKGAGDDLQVTVAFPEAGVRKLMLAYAKLELIG